MSNRVVILAGGLGTRLQFYTSALPKALVPIGGQPILEKIIHQLASQGYTHITLAVNHKAGLIKDYFGDGAALGIHIDYSLELSPLGTMGPLKLIPDLPEHFLVMNGDILTDLNYRHFEKSHLQSNGLFSISCCKRSVTSEFGILDIQEKKLIGFQEKLRIDYVVSMGIYYLNLAVLQYIPEHIPFGFDALMLKLLAMDVTVNTFQHNGEWLDIGNIEDYHRAEQMTKNTKETSTV